MHACSAPLASSELYSSQGEITGVHLRKKLVQAVLVANVSFLGYVTPPGRPHPYWETCNNRVYVAFMVLNGLAFLFSLGATGAALLVPCTMMIAP